MSPGPRDTNLLKLQSICWDLMVTMRLVKADVFSVGIWDTVLLYLREQDFDDVTLADLIYACSGAYVGDWPSRFTESKPVIPQGSRLTVGAACAIIKELQTQVGDKPHLSFADPPWEFLGSFCRDFEVLPPAHQWIWPTDLKVDLYANPRRTLVLVCAKDVEDREYEVTAQNLDVHAAEAVRRALEERARRP